MEPTHIVKRPLITEKCTWESGARNRYSFVVDMRARKQEIREAVAALYNVRVLDVATQIRKGREVRTRYGLTKKSDWKKATVQLHPEDKIDLF